MLLAVRQGLEAGSGELDLDPGLVSGRLDQRVPIAVAVIAERENPDRPPRRAGFRQRSKSALIPNLTNSTRCPGNNSGRHFAVQGRKHGEDVGAPQQPAVKCASSAR